MESKASGLERTLIIHCMTNRVNVPGTYSFEKRGASWIYRGLYPLKSANLNPRSANLKILGNLYALQPYGQVPAELNNFLDEQSKGRKKTEIVLEFDRVEGNLGMHVIDISSE